LHVKELSGARDVAGGRVVMAFRTFSSFEITFGVRLFLVFQHFLCYAFFVLVKELGFDETYQRPG
jgi:hypothetical protein